MARRLSLQDHARALSLCLCLLLLLSPVSSLPLQPDGSILLGNLNVVDASLGDAVFEAVSFAVKEINANSDILPDHPLSLISRTAHSPAEAMDSTMEFARKDKAAAILGPNFSSHAVVAGVTAASEDILLMGLASSERLNSPSYRNFFRTVPHDGLQCNVLVRACVEEGWTDFAIVSGYDAYSIGLTQCIQAEARESGVRLLGTVFYSIEDMEDLTMSNIEILQNTGTRVVVFTLQTFEYREWLKTALKQDFVGAPYNWVFVETGFAIFTKDDGTPDKDLGKYAKGSLVTGPAAGTDAKRLSRLHENTPSDPTSLYTGYAYDSTYAYAYTFHRLLVDQGLSLEEVTIDMFREELINGTRFDGITGRVEFDADGNRKNGLFSVWNHRGKAERPKLLWYLSGSGGEIDKVGKPLFSNGQSKPPSSKPSFPKKYYDCSKKELLDDPKGEIEFEPIDVRPNLLPEDNYCDGIVDCANWSDEGFDCSPSLAVGYVVFGILTVLASFTLVGGSLYLTLHRNEGIVRAMGMPYLWLFTFVSVVGMLTTLTVIGPAHDVSCQLRIWLPSVFSSLLIGVLSAKQYRVVRIFRRKSLRSIRISNAKLGAIILIILVPDLVVLTAWAAADLYHAEANDGDKSIICQSKWELVWLIVLLVYKGLLLVALSVMAFISRKFPAKYSESQQLGLAIYNTTLITAILIPITLAFKNNFAEYLFGTLFLFTFFFCPYIFICAPKIYLINRGMKEDLNQSSPFLSGASKPTVPT